MRRESPLLPVWKLHCSNEDHVHQAIETTVHAIPHQQNPSIHPLWLPDELGPRQIIFQQNPCIHPLWLPDGLGPRQIILMESFIDNFLGIYVYGICSASAMTNLTLVRHFWDIYVYGIYDW